MRLKVWCNWSLAARKSAMRWRRLEMYQLSLLQVLLEWARSSARRCLRGWGRPILELGGNNAMIVAPSADLAMAVRAIVFSAVGTAGQRCTSLRRLIVHKSIKDELIGEIAKAYSGLKIGDPRDESVLVGPLIDQHAGDAMMAAIERARGEGGVVAGGEILTDGVPAGGVYASPAWLP